MREPHPGSAALRRTVERLRSGTPPHEHLDALTRNFKVIRKSILQFIHREDRANRILWVRGPYGAGKSHMLGVVRELGLQERYATSFLSADGYGAALNHPERIVPVILQNLEMPHRDGGYAGLIYRLLGNADGRRHLSRIVDSAMSGGRILDYRCRSLAWLIANPEARDVPPDSEIQAVHAAELTQLLCGETLEAAPPSNTTRQAAYCLLDVAQQLVRLEDACGLLLEIDEVESLFTKLRDCRGRRGAYRTLAALGCWSTLSGVKLVLALTPDCDRWMREELPEVKGLVVATAEEPVAALVRAVFSDYRMVMDCGRLTAADVAGLAEAVHALYADAYHGASAGNGMAHIASRAARLAASGVPTRLIVREIINDLDIIRCSTN